MATINQFEALAIMPSLLDRLFDNRPLSPWERTDRERELRLQSKRFQDIHDLRRCVARDLERLLNTKRVMQQDVPDDYVEVKKSLVTYGLPDFTAFGLSNRIERNRVARSIEQAIAAHEPRLKRARVTIEETRTHERALRFRVDALLHVEPARESVSFDAVLQLTTQQYQIKSQD